MPERGDPPIPMRVVQRAVARYVQDHLARSDLRQDVAALLVEWWEDACIAGREPHALGPWLDDWGPRARARILRRAATRRTSRRDLRDMPDGSEQRLADQALWNEWRRALQAVEPRLRGVLTPRQTAAMDVLLSQPTMRDASSVLGVPPRDLRKFLLAISRKARSLMDERGAGGEEPR